MEQLTLLSLNDTTVILKMNLLITTLLKMTLLITTLLKMTLLITTLFIMTILTTLSTGDITYHAITYN
jgi:hypothetical protein